MLNIKDEYYNLSNWKTLTQLIKSYPQFTKSQIKYLFWQRRNKPGLERCCRIVGKTLYVNDPLFGFYLGGQLPEQNPENSTTSDTKSDVMPEN